MFRLIEPMPSPRGTNRAGLFIAARRRSPTMAYDAANGAEGHGFPEEQDPDTKLLAFLRELLEPADYTRAERMVTDLHDALMGEAGAFDRDEPRPGGTMDRRRARDAEGETEAEMRERHEREMAGCMDRARRARDGRRPRSAMDAAASFAARYPEAARIRNLG